MLTSCAGSNGPVSDNTPYVKIPDQPGYIYPKRTVIPKGPLDPEKTKIFLTLYEKNEDHNIRAINGARIYHKKMQRIYNSK